MRKKRLGNSDLYVSELGLGCMSIGTDEKTVQAIMETALDQGINYFDTADLYDFGENEKIVGKTLKKVRSEVIIATKVGNRWNDEQTNWSWDPSKMYMKEAVKNSLKRLNTDYIDLYQLHGGTIDDPIDETIAAFEELKSEGYIRYYGISSIRPNVIKTYVQKANIVSIMMQYSILDRRPEAECLPLLYEHGISVVTRGTLARGLLSEHMMAKISENGYLDYSKEELTKVLSLLKENFSSSYPLNSIALQYNLANPCVASVVIGASNPEQVISNVRASQRRALTEKEVSFIKAVTKATGYQKHC